MITLVVVPTGEEGPAHHSWQVTPMLSQYTWYGLIGLGAAVAFIFVNVLNIRYQRARRKADAKLTPEERRIKDAEDKAFQGIFRRR